MIKIENLSKKYGDKIILNDFNYVFPDSGFVAINGDSGIGKTTLLNIIMKIEIPDCGNVVLQKDGRQCRTSGPDKIDSGFIISAVFQEDRLLEYETALENVLLVMNDSERDKSKNARTEIKNKNIKKASEILRRMGLEKELDEKISKLSGGMKRRVAIARCLAVDADAYIMDEPIKGLDKDMSLETLKLIHEYTDKKGKLLIMVTHNQEDNTGSSDIIDFNNLL